MISDRGLGKLPGLKGGFCEITIQGHGEYIVAADLAAVIAGMCQQAQEFHKLVGDMRVPLYITGFDVRRYISAIKWFRQITGAPLKDSKYCCDKIRDHGDRYPIGTYSWTRAQEIIADAKDNSTIVEIGSALECLAHQAE